MIPKIIHYCWFGGKEKPKLALKCIKSWKKYCPDYQIIEWNEQNFDTDFNPYTKMCYENKKWAFLSDYVRLWVVNQYGGIYFDTDVELLKKPDELMQSDAYWGFETSDKSVINCNERNAFIASGLGFGSIANGVAIKEMLKEYDQLLDGNHGTIGCPILNTNALERMGVIADGKLQTFSWGTVYPSDYFDPYNSATGKLSITENTISVHWYMGSFLTPKQKIRSAITKPFHRVFGVNCFDFLKKNI